MSPHVTIRLDDGAISQLRAWKKAVDETPGIPAGSAKTYFQHLQNTLAVWGGKPPCFVEDDQCLPIRYWYQLTDQSWVSYYILKPRSLFKKRIEIVIMSIGSQGPH